MEYSRKLASINTANPSVAVEELFRLVTIIQEESSRAMTALQEQDKAMEKRLTELEG